MDGGEQLGRGLCFFDSRATEGEGTGDEEEKTLSSFSEISYTRRHIN